MHAFRMSKTLGSYANSDLFPGMLKRAPNAAGIGDYIHLDRLPASVKVDTSRFLAEVTISL